MATTSHLRTHVVVGMTLALGLLAGCATGQQTAVSPTHANSASQPRSSSPHAGIAYHQLTPKAAAFATSRTPPVGTVSAAWSMRPVAELAVSKRVYLNVDVPVCSGGKMAFTLATTGTLIEIGYWVRPTPKHAICSAMRVTTDGYIDLPTEVGQRTIVHVPTGRHASA